MGNLTESASFLSRHMDAFVPVFILLFGVFIWLLRGLIMFLSPTLAIEVLKDPVIYMEAKEPGAITGDPPVYLHISFDIRSWIKTGFWRHQIRLAPLGIGVITCDIFGSSHLFLELPERPQFADENNSDIKSTIMFRRKLADSNKQPGQIIITKIQLKINRKTEKSFRYSFLLAENQQIFKWGTGELSTYY